MNEMAVLKMPRLVRASGVLILLGLLGGQVHAHHVGVDPEVIVEWNQLLESVLPTAGLSPPRHYAMLHVAMFDAVNSIEKCYRPYRFSVRAHAGASPEAAAAQAAHDLLVAQFSASKDLFDAALAARLARISPFAARHGAQVGSAIAQKVLEWRANDGWSDPVPAVVLPPFPGEYQATPPAFGPAQFGQFAHTEPFALLTPTQFLSVPPPTVTSEHYAAAFNEAKALGSATSTLRTAEQTQLARLFASVITRTIHWGLWNHVARDTARARGLTLPETARLYALLNVSIHDGLQSSHTGKFIYGYWRPVTAIRRADEDLNPQTEPDTSWTPLLTTPPYATYPGNQACVGASAARALALFYGTDAVPFTAVWLGNASNPDVSRPYQSFWQMAVDQADSRLFGGIHWRFDNEASQQSCVQVPEYVFARFMQPR